MSGSVLDAVYEVLHDDLVARYAEGLSDRLGSLQPVARDLRSSFGVSRPVPLYSSRDVQDVYVLRNLPPHLAMALDVLRRLGDAAIPPEAEELRVVLVGCGPAPEIGALAAFLAEARPETQRLVVDLVDPAADAWSTTWPLTGAEVAGRLWTGTVTITGHRAGLGSLGQNRNVLDTIASAHLVMVQNCLSEVDETEALRDIGLVADALDPGAALLIADLEAYDAVGAVFKRLRSEGRAGLVAVPDAGPRLIRIDPPPGWLADGLLTGEDGLKARRNVRYRHVLFWRPAERKQMVEGLARSQHEALDRFATFLDGELDAFVVTGRAGTGKSYLVRQLIHTAAERGLAVELMVPTGRGAKVLTARTGVPARTVHGVVYTFDKLEEAAPERSDLPGFRFAVRSPEAWETPLFLVDEASLLSDVKNSDEESADLVFGSGKVLSDLVSFGRSHGGDRARFVFVGDRFQLPPVGMHRPPALDVEELTARGLTAEAVELQDVLRQGPGSEILTVAEPVRLGIEEQTFSSLDLSPGGEVVACPAAGLVEDFLAARARLGNDGVVVVCPTNDATAHWNGEIRARLHPGAGPLVPGETLLVATNHPSTGLVNGQFVTVVSLGDPEVIRGKKGSGETVVVREVEIAADLPEGRAEHSVLLAEDFLPGLDARAAKGKAAVLWADFIRRHSGIRPQDVPDVLRDDLRYNALRARYGYAVTGHKAQGGEWPAVFVAFEGRPEWRNEDGFRWIYTALTRASERLYLVDPPSFVPWSGMTESEALPALERRDPVLSVHDAEVALSSRDFAVIRLDAPQRPVRLRLVRHEVSLDLDLYCDVHGYIVSRHPTRPATEETAPLLAEVSAVLDAAEEKALRSRLDVRAASFDRHLRHLATAHDIRLDLVRIAPALVYRLRRGEETATGSFWSRKDGRMRTWNLHAGSASGLADELRAWFPV